MKISTNKFITNLGLVFGISLLTAFFVLLIQSLSFKAESELSFDEIIDVDNIRGYIIEDPSELINNEAQLDRLVSDDELNTLNEDGYVRVDDFTDGKNAMSFGIEKIFIDISSSQYSEIFGESGGENIGKVKFNAESELPHVVKMCGSIKTEMPCNIKVKNEDNTQMSTLKVSMENKGGEKYLLLEQSKISENLEDNDLKFIGKGVVELEFASLR